MEIVFPLIIQLGLALLTQGPQVIERLIAVGEQSGALTPEQAAQVRQQMVAALASRAWQTDEQLAAAGANDPVTGTALPPGSGEGPLAGGESAGDAVPPPAGLTRAPGNG